MKIDIEYEDEDVFIGFDHKGNERFKNIKVEITTITDFTDDELDYITNEYLLNDKYYSEYDEKKKEYTFCREVI